MSIEMIALRNLKPSVNNPRKSFHEETIEGLAASIKQDGLLHNLVVLKPKGRKKTYQIIGGERRYRALSLLVEQGELPSDVSVPCEVRDELTDQDAHRIATIENIQRENLAPLEEAEAVVALLQDGAPLDDVCAQTGLSERTIKRRLALCSLTENAKTALSEGVITLAQAEALTVGTHDQQSDWLECEYYREDSASDIKDFLIHDKPSVALALFDVNQYSGTFTRDLFADADTTYFDDVDQFYELQYDAVEQLVDELKAEGFDPVEIIENRCFSDWQYRDAEEGETGGAIVHIHPCGEVEVHKHLINRNLEKKAAELVNEPSKPRASYSRPLRDYVAMHKTLAVQAGLLDNPRIAKELAIVQMVSGHNGMSLSAHRALCYFAESENAPTALQKLQAAMSLLWPITGKTETEFTHYVSLCCTPLESVDLYDMLKSSTDQELDQAHLLLSTLCFGQLNCDRLDTYEDSLFNRVANDLKVDMREQWIPDEAFLSRRSLSQLKEIIMESGLRRFTGNGEGIKKGKLVKMLADQFARIAALDEPNDAEQKIKGWLPAVFEFPAIDPDGQQEVEAESEAEAPAAIADAA